MIRTYAQTSIDGLFEEGDRDHHFLAELLAHVNTIFTKPFGIDAVTLDKTEQQQFEDVLKLAEFFIADGSYEGFYMPVYGQPYRAFKTFFEFEKFLRGKLLATENFFELVTTSGDAFYSIGLAKIKPRAKAPAVTSQIEEIYRY